MIDAGEVVGEAPRQHIRPDAGSLAASIIAYLETLTLAGGDHDGAFLTVLPWQRQFLEGAFGCSGDVAISVGRGGARVASLLGLQPRLSIRLRRCMDGVEK